MQCVILPGVIFEEIDDALVTLVIGRVLQDRRPLARPRERHGQDFSDARRRAVRHQDEAIGQVQCLIHIVRHHDDDLPVLLPHVQQRVLHVEARE